MLDGIPQIFSEELTVESDEHRPKSLRIKVSTLDSMIAHRENVTFWEDFQWSWLETWNTTEQQGLIVNGTELRIYGIAGKLHVLNFRAYKKLVGKREHIHGLLR